MPQRVAITGASGLIGGALSAYLAARGDEVLHLVRRLPHTAAEIQWDPGTRELDPACLEGVDAVVHLAGAGVGDRRWTPQYKQEIFGSRVDGTHTVATALAQLGHPVTLVSASATGFYGSDRGDEVLTEDSAGGSGFLADVVRAWEAAAGPAVDAGLRVVHPRSGLVMSAHGGAFGRLLPLVRFGLGGPLGSGRQWWSWITLHDEVRALAHLIDSPDLSGPVNLVSPQPLRQGEVVRALATSIRRPAVLPAPRLAMRAVLGEFAGEVLGSQRVLPSVLTASGFTFDHDQIDKAVDWLLAQG